MAGFTCIVSLFLFILVSLVSNDKLGIEPGLILVGIFLIVLFGANLVKFVLEAQVNEY